MNKQHILEEIEQTAKANGGKPLGWRRFYQETGIKEFDWKGKYWVRWNDAVREAGFEPNQKNEAYNEHLLVEKFALLTRKLSHFPVNAELRFEINSDESFPSEKTFRKLGSKQQIASKIMAFCKTQGGYDDVIAICESLAKTQPVPPESNVGSEVKFGYVYLIKSGKSGNTYKIGWSKNANIRQYQLQTGSPEQLNIVHEIKTDDPSGIEGYWHKRFADKRIDPNKEWFKLTSEDVRAFKRMKFA